MVLPRSGTGWLLERNQLRSVHEAERLDINSEIRAPSRHGYEASTEPRLSESDATFPYFRQIVSWFSRMGTYENSDKGSLFT